MVYPEEHLTTAVRMYQPTHPTTPLRRKQAKKMWHSPPQQRMHLTINRAMHTL
jgi:hypothetical protein